MSPTTCIQPFKIRVFAGVEIESLARDDSDTGHQGHHRIVHGRRRVVLHQAVRSLNFIPTTAAPPGFRRSQRSFTARPPRGGGVRPHQADLTSPARVVSLGHRPPRGSSSRLAKNRSRSQSLTTPIATNSCDDLASGRSGSARRTSSTRGGKWLPALPDEMGTWARILQVPPLPDVPEVVRGVRKWKPMDRRRAGDGAEPCFSTLGCPLLSGVPLEPADTDPGEYDDVAEARQQRQRVAAVPGVQVEHAGEQRHHRSDWRPARD
jgi:hypothetical protein